MSITTYGANSELFVTYESTSYATYQAVSAGDAVGHIETTISPTQERIPSEEHVGSNSRQSDIEGQRGGSFSVKTYLKREAAGTAPEISNLLAATFQGASTNNGTVITNTLDSDVAPLSLQLIRYIGAEYCEWANGCVVETIVFGQDGTAPPTVTFSGSFSEYGALKGAVNHTDTVATADTTCDLAAADAFKVRQGAVIYFAADTNTAAGYLVTSVSDDGLTLTFTPGLAGAGQTAAAITPAIPTGTYSGTIVNGIASGLSFDGGATELGFVSGSVTMTTGNHLLYEGNSGAPTCPARGQREVSCEFSFYLRDENSHLDQAGWTGQSQDVHFRIGSGAVVNFTCDLPAVIFGPMDTSVPQAGELVASISGNAFQSAVNDDEFTLVIGV